MDFLNELAIDTLNPAAFSSGEWLTSDKTLASINPATGKTIASVGSCSAVEYDRVSQAAVDAFTSWRRVPAPQRGEMVRQIGESLRRYKDALGSLIALETGKIKQEADGEVQEMIDIADFATGLSRMLYGKTMHSERPRHRLYEQWHPLGVVGAITAFNFPAAVWAWNAFIAAVTGDTVIWKPSPQVPLTAIAVQHIVNRVMRDAGHQSVFSLFITEDHAVAERLVADPRVALVSFTGSSAVGRHVGALVAQRMGRSLLECSGNNAVIVDETANLDLALRAILFGAIGTAGQRCTSTRRLIVHETLFDELAARLGDAYSQVTVGDPMDPRTLMGPLIDATACDSFASAIKQLRVLGGQVRYGGARIPGPGFFVQPTLVVAKNHWAIVQQETFAPILYLIRYKDFENAIALHNAVPQGLSSALFTENLRHAEWFLSEVGSDCGIANVNVGTSGAEIGGAFGGEKDTGGGREAGSDAWKAYMRRQTNTINWGTDLSLAQGIRFDLPKIDRPARRPH